MKMFENNLYNLFFEKKKFENFFIELLNFKNFITHSI